MTVRKTQKFSQFGIFAGLLLLAACNPLDSGETTVGQRQYVVEKARLFSNDSDLGIKDVLTYPKAERKGPADIRTNIPNRDLTINRCTWCHECGFTNAFNYADFGTDKWKPYYKGEEWRSSVMRMNDNDETMLNEQIAERIYNYLHDVTLGIYDPEKDRGPEVRIEVDDIKDVNVIQGTVVDDDGNPVEDTTSNGEEGDTAPPAGQTEGEG